MKKSYKNLLLLLMVCIVALLLVIPTTTAHAVELSGTLSFITGVELTDSNGNLIGRDDIPLDAEFKLKYTYRIEDTAHVFSGDTYTFYIPNEIKIANPGAFELVATGVGKIADGFLSSDGRIQITFTGIPSGFSEIYGEFWWSLEFNPDNIGGGDETIINFEVGVQTGPYEVIIKFDQPEPLPTSIVKSGSYDPATKSILWQMDINPEDVRVLDGVIVDTMPSGLSLDVNSVELNGIPMTENVEFTYIGDVFTFNLPSVINTKQILTFKTIVDDSLLTQENSHGTTIIVENDVMYKHDLDDENNPIITYSEIAEVEILVNFITKSGKYNLGRKQIDWTVTVNSNYINITNAKFMDTLPLGLTLDEDTFYVDNVKIDTTNDSDFDYTYPLISYDLGTINEPHTIKYSTDVEPTLYEKNASKTYTNSAKLEGDDVPDNANVGVGVRASSWVISKEHKGYDKVTGEISWKIIINQNTVSLKDPVITDLINDGQKYVEGSAKLDGVDIDVVPSDPKFTYTVDNDDASGYTGELKYEFGTTINSEYVIEFKTKLTNPYHYAGNVVNAIYYNRVKLVDGDGNESTNQDNQYVTSNVLDKSGIGYDYKTRVITWQIVVNDNEMTLNDVVITDIIPDTMEFVDDSGRIDGAEDTTGFSYASATKTLKYEFAAPITDRHVITFETKITDLSIFSTNGAKYPENTASIKHSLIDNAISDTGSQKIENTVVSKVAEYTDGNRYIDWTITINTNYVPLSSAVITDEFEDGLELDTSSVRLFYLNVDSAGNLSKGDEILGLTGDNVNYNENDNNTLIFTIPLPPGGGAHVSGYILQFTTDVVDKDKSPFTNRATFNGEGIDQSGTSDPIRVGWADSGSSGTAIGGSITVTKVDADDNSTIFEDAEFVLIDQYDNIIQRKSTLTTGEVLFDRLRFNVPYKVLESIAPIGYNKNENGYVFILTGASDSINITYDYEDTIIRGHVEFMKYDDSSKVLSGAEFTAYDSSGASVGKAYSDGNGVVSFRNLKFGAYTFRETNPPVGYLSSIAILSATITQEGATVTASPSSVSNQLIRGMVMIKKIDAFDNAPLAEAELTLFKDSDTSFSTPIVQGVSKFDGIVVFADVPYGTYYIKETKAPSGYALTNELILVNIVNDGVLVDAGEFENEQEDGPITSPDTGDNIQKYIATFISSAMMIALLIMLQLIIINKNKKRSLRSYHL